MPHWTTRRRPTTPRRLLAISYTTLTAKCSPYNKATADHPGPKRASPEQPSVGRGAARRALGPRTGSVPASQLLLTKGTGGSQDLDSKRAGVPATRGGARLAPGPLSAPRRTPPFDWSVARIYLRGLRPIGPL
eukprot:9475515-Pyramimonas_sp.AAC.1